jgi:NAD+ synthase
MKELDLPWKRVVKGIEKGIREYFKRAGFKKAVVGLSGGLDSTVTVYLLVRSLGKENVIAVMLPEKGVTPRADVADSMEVVRELGIKYFKMEISPVISAFTKIYPRDAKRVKGKFKYPKAYGNVKARTRMIALYKVAQTNEALVVGTSDRSELLLGYFTKWGDGGVDLEPIGSLYKTQVRGLGKYLGIPEKILRKAPSPRLLPGQMAEKELKLEYEKIDLIFYYKFDQNLSRKRIAEKLGLEKGVVDRIFERVKKVEHKRNPPPIIKFDLNMLKCKKHL